MRKHPLGLALLDDASVPHDEHALCDGADKRQIVSPIIAPIVRRGLNEPAASWNTI